MNTRKVLISVLTLVVLCGCSDREDVPHFAGDFCELTPRLENIQTNVGDRVAFDKLPEDAILVAVNGYPLTKKRFDELMVMKAKQLSEERDANVALVNNKLEHFKAGYLKMFISQRLMIDRARELQVFTPEELEDKVNAIVQKAAEARKMTVKRLAKSYTGDFKYYLYETAARLYMDRLILKHIPPKVKVDDAFVEVVKTGIRAENEAIRATNDLIRAQMAQWRLDIANGKVKFEDLAKEKNQDDYADDGNPGYWGTFERGTIDDKRLQSVVFSLPVGEISQPVEDDEGYHLIKIYEVTRPERNESGRVIQDEVRKVGHILRKKLPMLIEDTDDILVKDLKYQMQLKAVNEYVSNLATNGSNKVVFPYGKNILD